MVYPRGMPGGIFVNPRADSTAGSGRPNADRFGILAFPAPAIGLALVVVAARNQQERIVNDFVHKTMCFIDAA